MYDFRLYSWAMVAGVVVALLLAWSMWRRRRTTAARCLAGLELAVAAWTFGMAFEAAATTVRLKFVWSVVAYPGTVAAPLMFFLFALAYGGFHHWLTRRHMAALALLPAATVVAAAANPWHRAVWTSITVQPNNIALYGHGWFFWIFVAYSYLLLGAGGLIVLASLRRHATFYRGQALVLLIGALFPFAGNVMYVFNLNPVPGLEWTPLGFLVAGGCLAAGMRRFSLLDLVPLARRTVVDTMPDAMAVLDEDLRLIDLNPAMRILLGDPGRRLFGSEAAALPFWDTLKDALAADAAAAGHLRLADDRIFDYRVVHLRHRPGDPVLHLLLLHDSTERQRLLDERDRLIADLQGALAEVKTLTDLLPICASCKKIRNDDGYWQNVEVYMHEHASIRFSHGICPDCAQRLYPGIRTSRPPA